MNDTEYNQLKSKLEAYKEQRSQAAGALAELMRQLKDDFGLHSLEAAKEEVKRLEAKRDRMKVRADREYEKLMKKWGSKLDLD